MRFAVVGSGIPTRRRSVSTRRLSINHDGKDSRGRACRGTRSGMSRAGARAPGSRKLHGGGSNPGSRRIIGLGRLVRRERRGSRPLLQPFQRDVGSVLLSGNAAARSRAVRLRQRRRPRHLPGPGRHAGRGEDARGCVVSTDGRFAVERTTLSERPPLQPRRHPDTSLHRRHRTERHRRARIRHGDRRRRLQQRRMRRHLPHVPGPEPPVSEQLRRHLHGRIRPEPDRRERLGRVGGVRRLRSRRLAGSLCRPVCPVRHRERPDLPLV